MSTKANIDPILRIAEKDLERRRKLAQKVARKLVVVNKRYGYSLRVGSTVFNASRNRGETYATARGIRHSIVEALLEFDQENES